MIVSVFQATYPVFKKTDPIQIQATLNRASRALDPTVWGTQYDDGVGLLAAHYLSVDPYGSTTALKSDARSVYLEQFEDLRRSIVGGGFGVVGGTTGPWS